MTDGWNEVSDSLAKTGLFKDDQLNPENAPRILADLVRRHTSVIGYGADGRPIPIGSGTFLRLVDGQFGILRPGTSLEP